MNAFELRDHLIRDYAAYIDGFIQIREPRLDAYVQQSLRRGVLWPEPLIQLNPSFQPGDWIDDLVSQAVLHEACGNIFRVKPEKEGTGKRLRLHQHQSDVVRTAQIGANYVLTTGYRWELESS